MSDFKAVSNKPFTYTPDPDGPVVSQEVMDAYYKDVKPSSFVVDTKKGNIGIVVEKDGGTPVGFMLTRRDAMELVHLINEALNEET